MEEIIIKKYENRRLYNTKEKKYISISEIEQLIKDGNTIKVVEKKTGEDITKEILMQALLESSYDVLPVFFIHMLIQAPSNVLKPFFNDYFPQFFNYYLSMMQQNSMQGPKNPMSAMQGFNPFNSMANPFAGQPNPFNSFGANPFQNMMQPQNNDAMQKILARLAELEDKIDKK